jgi:hypothetical protein
MMTGRQITAAFEGLISGSSNVLPNAMLELDDRYGCIRACVGDAPSPEDCAGLLRQNAALPLVKYALDAEGCVCLLAEFPRAELTEEVMGELVAALRGSLEAHESVRAGQAIGDSERTAAGDTTGLLERISRWLEQSRWSVREAQECLEVHPAGEPSPTRISLFLVEGDVVLRVGLASSARGPVAARALAVWLMMVGYQFRLIRGVLDAEGPGLAARLTATVLSEAVLMPCLSALWAAGKTVREEGDPLSDAGVAAMFLAHCSPDTTQTRRYEPWRRPLSSR